MRIARFIDESGQTQWGQDLGDDRMAVLDRSPIEAFPALPTPTGAVVQCRQRLAPVQPTNIFCIGLNYRAHANEMGSALPEYPVIFMKPTSAVIGPGEPIKVPRVEHGPETDQEAELAVVIGKPARDVSEDEALDYVLGYTAANDVSARWWQKQGSGGQFVRGKGFDTFCPLGPVLVTPAPAPGSQGDTDDAINDPQALTITGRVNGQVLQHATTADMIFSVAKLIAHLSQDTTLLPGTLILTGTPAGVGWARNPKQLLRPGGLAEVEIQTIGILTNPIT